MLTQLIQLMTAINLFFDSWKKVVLTIGISFMFFLGSLASPQIASYFGTDYISAINDRIHINTPVMDILASTQDKIKSNRIIVAELHDGKSNVSGVKFAYLSANYEVVQPGTAKLLLDMQNLPTSMFTKHWSVLGGNNCNSVDVDAINVTRNEDSVAASYAGYGVEYAIICPIFEPNTSMMLGVIVGFWHKDVLNIDKEADVKALKESALILSGILSGKGDSISLWTELFGE